MVRKLTKVTKDGNVYARPKKIALQIKTCLKLSSEELSRKLENGDPKSINFIQSECLVHLIRDALRNDNKVRYNLILPILLLRCEKNLIWKISDNSIIEAESIREDMLSEFVELFITDLNDDSKNELDFFECRFNLAFNSFRSDKLAIEINRINLYEDLPRTFDNDQLENDEDILAKVSEAAKVQPNQEHNLSLKELQKELRSLPEKVRISVMLKCFFGYQIESKNPNEITVSTLCKCSSRTIRNRLEKAKSLLAHLKEDV